ncbi:MAG: phosphoribosyltransferase family protein [Saprospiraceae bacterium]
MQILKDHQIKQKIRRLAIEILERNTTVSALTIVGVNRNGMYFANMIADELARLSPLPITRTHVHLSPANPLESPITTGLPLSDFAGKAILVVDDVANTGRTLFYACKPFMDVLPLKIETAVLVDRTHKSFPIKVDYYGISLATTLMDNIQLNYLQKKNWLLL